MNLPVTIFVFGSNLAGIHGAGSAREAYENHGARWGCGVGLQGTSYAIPTKGRNNLRVSLPLDEIEKYVDDFIEFAQENPKITFRCVAVGCGLAGYTPQQMAPMFKDAPGNVMLPFEFRNVLGTI